MDFPSFTQNFTLTHCSALTLNMIPTENKNTIHFKQWLLRNCLPYNLEILTINGGEMISRYNTQLTVANFTGKRKKIQSGYFIATPRMCTDFLPESITPPCYLLTSLLIMWILTCEKSKLCWLMVIYKHVMCAESLYFHHLLLGSIRITWLHSNTSNGLLQRYTGPILICPHVSGFYIIIYHI